MVHILFSSLLLLLTSFFFFSFIPCLMFFVRQLLSGDGRWVDLGNRKEQK